MGPSGRNQEQKRQHLGVPRAKALLVDEDPNNLRYYRNVFEGYGYRVKTCSSYPEAIRCLADEVFDFVMVSQGTPNFEGSCVLKRAIAINRRLPVLIVARCLEMSCYLEAMQLGAVDYLVEPLTVAGIRRVLENHPPRQDLPSN